MLVTMLFTRSKTGIIISATLNLSSATALNLDQSKTLSSGNRLIMIHTTFTLSNNRQLVGWLY